MEYPSKKGRGYGQNATCVYFHLEVDVGVRVRRAKSGDDLLTITAEDGVHEVVFLMPPGGTAAIAKEILKQIGETDEEG